MISELPLFAFTTLAGLSIGAYVASAVFSADSAGERSEAGLGARRPWLIPLACLVLLAAGLLCLPAHLGRPERMLIALTQPGAMIAQEAYWSAGFGAVLLADFAFAKAKGATPRALRIAGAVIALGLTFVMANAYFVSAGVAAWASWQTFPLYFFGNLAMGFALAAALEGGIAKAPAFFAAEIALALLAAAAFALEAVHFASAGADMLLLVVATAVAVAGAALAFMAKRGKLSGSTAAWIVFVCLFAAVALARYGFYAACAL